MVPVWRNGILEEEESELTNLDLVLVWLHLVHLSTRTSTRAGLGARVLTEVVIVGTHSSSLAQGREQQLEVAELLGCSCFSSRWQSCGGGGFERGWQVFPWSMESMPPCMPWTVRRWAVQCSGSSGGRSTPSCSICPMLERRC